MSCVYDSNVANTRPLMFSEAYRRLSPRHARQNDHAALLRYALASARLAAGAYLRHVGKDGFASLSRIDLERLLSRIVWVVQASVNAADDLKILQSERVKEAADLTLRFTHAIGKGRLEDWTAAEWRRFVFVIFGVIGEKSLSD
ncbi:hypothetical protein [Azospirillum tabaci]|uniref:hypothetical protein n=1 Tax=Azospirillum tabaci TaxID=2752310 RepID=UPI001660D785|nr:hypothetical protein [Azospirillum tabaci]